MQLGARHACINYQSNVECDSQMGEGETGWFSSTPPMHWFGIQTVPLLFPAVLVGLPEGDEDETSNDDNEEEQRYNFSYIGHSRASVPKGCCTVKTCI